jgi:ABC-type multidrug transport system fused ATPase/permease subunit
VEAAHDVFPPEEEPPQGLALAALRAAPLDLEWQRISCSYRAQGGTKVVLHEIYGRAAPGEMQVDGAGWGGEGLGGPGGPGAGAGATPLRLSLQAPLAAARAFALAPRPHPRARLFTPPCSRPAPPLRPQALLGPSGAGKSTLMDILAQRKSVGVLTGQLLVAGHPAGRGFIRCTAYVPQDDNFVPTMTTAETMRFYAAIILPDEMGRAGRLRRVEEVLAALGLGNHHKTLVGGTLPGGLMLRGLSGGERKRLSIAAGILAAPSVVFLDEPTSGLDSFAALSVRGPGGGAGEGQGVGAGPCARWARAPHHTGVPHHSSLTPSSAAPSPPR